MARVQRRAFPGGNANDSATPTHFRPFRDLTQGKAPPERGKENGPAAGHTATVPKGLKSGAGVQQDLSPAQFVALLEEMGVPSRLALVLERQVAIALGKQRQGRLSPAEAVEVMERVVGQAAGCWRKAAAS